MVRICLSCGCCLDGSGTPTDDHGNDANLTFRCLSMAAMAVGISVEKAAANIVASLAVSAGADGDDPATPADELVVVAKALDAPGAAQRFMYGVAYPADRVDGHKEFIRAEELERIAWDFARNHRTIGFFHADGTTHRAAVVESAIHRGPTYVRKDIAGNEVEIRQGDWLLGAVADPIGWSVTQDLVRKGHAIGWSIDGLMKKRVARLRTPAGA